MVRLFLHIVVLEDDSLELARQYESLGGMTNLYGADSEL